MSRKWTYEIGLGYESILRDGVMVNKEQAVRALNNYESRIAELEAEKECEMRVFKDGNAWCFVLPDFQDLQVSPSVWMQKGVLDKIYKELRSVRDE